MGLNFLNNNTFTLLSGSLAAAGATTATHWSHTFLLHVAHVSADGIDGGEDDDVDEVSGGGDSDGGRQV